MICTECDLFYFVKQDGSACVSDCWNNDGNSYIALDRKKCVPNCYIDSLSYGSSNNVECVSVCDECYLLIFFRFVLEQYIDTNNNCKLCSEISNCLNCSYSNLVLTCTKCSTDYYFSQDSTKCV